MKKCIAKIASCSGEDRMEIGTRESKHRNEDKGWGRRWTEVIPDSDAFGERRGAVCRAEDVMGTSG